MKRQNIKETESGIAQLKIYHNIKSGPLSAELFFQSTII